MSEQNQFGKIAKASGYQLEIQVLRSAAGYYLGTFDQMPRSRESAEYFPTKAKAEEALATGRWTQHEL